MTNSRRKKSPRSLKPIRPQVAGIDIGAAEHWVCGPVGEDGQQPVEVFRTTTPQLREIVTWLRTHKVESVAMESTYIYWIPLYEMLEEAGFEVILVNARTLKNVPGRKTDLRDCQWLQLLHSCGLLRGSFRPKENLAQLRTLERQRAQLIKDRTRAIQWMQKALDHMNIRVHRAVTDLTGVTGMKIIRAIVEGERDPMKLASLRDVRCKKSVEEIAENLTGTWRGEHLFNLKKALEVYEHLQACIGDYDTELLRRIEVLTPENRQEKEAPRNPNRQKAKAVRARGDESLRVALYRWAGQDLTTIDGISPSNAQLILSEVGSNIEAFPTEKHFVSWIGLAPSTPYSGGKPVKGRRVSFAANRLGHVLRLAAVSLQRSSSALGATFRRIARRKSGVVAAMAVARKLAQLVYRLLRHGTPYFDIGARAYEEQYAKRRLSALKRNAHSLGYELKKEAKPAA